MFYGFVLPAYVVVFTAKGWWRGIQEWRSDRAHLESLARAAHPSKEGRE